MSIPDQFQAWRSANSRGESIQDAQDFADQTNLAALQASIAARRQSYVFNSADLYAGQTPYIEEATV
jgi:hypothetical protein